jgi:hypothetical protein
VVVAWAVLEDTAECGLESLQQQSKEGVRRGLVEQLSPIRCRILGQPVAEASVSLAGVGAVVVAWWPS